MPYLRWDDHSAHVVSLVSKLYKNLELTDCTLDTEGGLVYGHKALIGACSPYLKKLIMDHHGMENICIKEVKFNDMKHILDFVYFGEVDVSVSDLPSLLETAQLLQIPSLSDYSLAFSEKSCSTRLCDESMNDSVAKCTVNVTKSDGDISVEEYNAYTGNVLKELSQTHIHIALTNSVPNSIVSNLDMANEEAKILQDDFTPFTFVAVSPRSVKSERYDDEFNAACGALLEVEDPLEAKNPVNADLSREIKREKEVQSASEVKKEIEEVAPDNESNDVYEAMGMNCVSNQNGANRLTHSENICGKKSIENVRIVETESCVSFKSGFAEGMEDLQMEFEAISDTPKCELSEVKALEIRCDNEAVDDNNDLLTSDKERVPLNCEAQTTPLINIRSVVNQVSDVPNTQRREINEQTVSSEGVHRYSKMNVGNNYSALQELSRPLRASITAAGKDYKLERRSRELLDSIRCDIAISEKECGASEPLTGNVCVYFTGSMDQEHKTKKGVRQSHSKKSKLKRFSCKICDQSFNRGDMLKKHRLIHVSGKRFKCDDCGATFSQSFNLNLHKRKHTGIKPFKCDDCGATFLHSSNLKVHKRIHTRNEPFKCEDCGASFSDKGNLRKHILVHTGIKPFKCDICGASFSESGYLKTHKRIHTGIIPFKCDDCEATFSHSSHLKRHKLIHTVITPFKCDDCGALFSRNGYLKVHKRIHTRIKPFKCDDCGSTFFQNHDLKRHKLIHTGIKPFKCDVCEATFSLNGNLKVHKRVHTGIKPFKCEDCGATFSQSGYLRIHRRIHTGIKPFKCDDCGATFSVKGYLRKHIRIHTKE